MALDITFDENVMEYYSYKDSEYISAPIGNMLVEYLAINLDNINDTMNSQFQNKSSDFNELSEKYLKIVNSLTELHIYFAAFAEKFYYKINDTKESFEFGDITLEEAEIDLKNTIRESMEAFQKVQHWMEPNLRIFEDNEEDHRPFKDKYQEYKCSLACVFQNIVYPELFFKDINGTLVDVFRFSTNKSIFMEIELYNICKFELSRLIIFNLSGRIDFRVKECANCHRLFIKKGKYKTEYCDRLVNNTNKTCKQIGARKTYKEEHKDDVIRKIYNREYNTRYRRVHDYNFLQETDFKEWQKEAKKIRNKALIENWDKDKFLEELSKIKVRKGE